MIGNYEKAMKLDLQLMIRHGLYAYIQWYTYKRSTNTGLEKSVLP